MPTFKDWVAGRTVEAGGDIVDADEFYLRDDSGDVSKRVTYSGLKTALETALDERYVPLVDEIFIGAADISLGAVSPSDVSRTFVSNRDAITFPNKNTGDTTHVVVDPIAAGIGHWVTFTPTFVLAAVGSDSGDVRMRAGAVVTDTTGTLGAISTVGETAALETMPGTTDAVVEAVGGAIAVGGSGIWRIAFGRNGDRDTDTSTQSVNLLGVILTKAS